MSRHRRTISTLQPGDEFILRGTLDQPNKKRRTLSVVLDGSPIGVSATIPGNADVIVTGRSPNYAHDEENDD